MKITVTAGALAGMAALALSSGALAQSPEAFYADNDIELYVGYSPGGGYDTYARLLARHLGGHIPGNPEIIVRNMEGAGGLTLTNWLYSAAPPDGTAFGTIARGIPFDPLFGLETAQFDALEMNWIGSMNNEVSLCVSWHDSPVETLADLREQDLIVGGTAASTDANQFPRVLNAVLGTRFDVVSGYAGGNEINLAMEQGEVDGTCGLSWSSVISTRQHWLDDDLVNLLVQLTLEGHPDLEGVPVVVDLAETDEERQILSLVFARQVLGRPFVAPPNVPEERLETLREAFMETLEDEAFLAEAAEASIEITPIAGATVENLIVDAYATDDAIVQETSAILLGSQ